MNQFKCVLTDDEPIARQIVKDYINDIEELTLVAECKNAIETEAILKEHNIDILFLDIEMPKLSGVQFLEMGINVPVVIFTTAHHEYAVEAFEIEAFDYLLKPIAFDRFFKSVNRAKRYLTGRNANDVDSWISVKDGKRLYKIEIEQILYCQAYGDYVRIKTVNDVFSTKSTLQNFITNLPETFVQIHRSYVLNVKYIDYIEGNMVVLQNESLPISSSYKDNLLNHL